MLCELLIVLLIGGALFYHWATKNNDFFVKRNIPHDKATFLFGALKDVNLKKKTTFQHLCEIYRKHEGMVYGVFENRQPVFYIRDPDMIKHITIKDFDHFINHRNLQRGNRDTLLSNSLVKMEDDRWRDMRSTLTPVFTGSKLRQMFQLIVQSIDEALGYLREEQRKNSVNPAEGFELELKDFTSRLTTDIIASTAFGLQVNSYRDKDNEFYVTSKNVIKFSAKQILKVMFIMIFPKIAEYLKVDAIDKKHSSYFMHLVLDAMKYRQENNIHRPDMINLLMEARGMIPSAHVSKSQNHQWSDMEMVAQCFLFYLAGFETTAGLMSLASHELMENPDVQNRLYEEIQQTDEELEGQQLTYEALQKMTYMEMVVSEVLRKWPIPLSTDRMCNKDFEYVSPSTGERVVIKKGDVIRIPICGIHLDPKYYENPNVIDPERFNGENKSKIQYGTYLPFGMGPRSCIGNRFALLEAKTFLYYLLRDYRLEPSPKSCIPLVLDPKSVNLMAKNGFWIKFIPRKS